MIRERLFSAFPKLQPFAGHSTNHYSFRLTDHRGLIGIVPSFSHNFCASCSKLRITTDTRLIACLYHHESIYLAPALKAELPEEELKKRMIEAVQQRPKDGHKSSHDTAASSMSRIGG